MMNPADRRVQALLSQLGDPLQFWTVKLPRNLDPWMPSLADSFADDAWMAPWQKLASIGPLVALAVGFLAPWLWPGMNNIYSESLFFLLLATVSGIVNGSFGASLFLGYVVGDLLLVVLKTGLLFFV